MKILALDTSTLSGSAAVTDDGDVLAEVTARVRATHSEQILALVDRALQLAGVTLRDIHRLAVDLGPGSFTGVRIGLSTAKGLQLGTGLDLYGVSSLDVLAASAWGAHGNLLAALDARRNEVYAGLYRGDGTARATSIATLHGGPEVVGQRVVEAVPAGDITVVGDLDDVLFRRLSSAAPERFVRAPRAAATPLARYVAWEVHAGRGVLDRGDLEPEYVRGSDAKLPGGRGVGA